MRTTLLIALALALAGGALANPNNLQGATFIAHAVPALPYSTVPPAAGWCGAYAPYAINTLYEVNAQVPQGWATWYVLAAWECEAKLWCGVEFGFGSYDPEPFAFHETMPCFPTTGLELPTPGWPGPGEGTAFVTTGEPWYGNFVPVYWFGGYAYDASHGSTVIQIDVDPPTALCGVANCGNPPSTWSVGYDQRGGMGVNEPGQVPSWGYCTYEWACCLWEPPYCVLLTEQECYYAGGEWHEYLDCDPDPCEHPGACCVGGRCEIMFEENCTIILGGTFLGPDTLCEPNPCPAVCCFEQPTAPHGCEILLEAECQAAQGFWHPEWTTCEPNPCEIYTPVEETSWGRIKGMYR